MCFLYAKSLQSCPTLCNPVNCSPPGSSVHGIFQPRMLEWVAMPFSTGSSQPRDRTQVSMSVALASRFFTTSATRETPYIKQITNTPWRAGPPDCTECSRENRGLPEQESPTSGPRSTAD